MSLSVLQKFRVDPARRRRLTFSASQIELWRQCKRKWYLAYLCGARSPSSPSQEIGTKIHAEIEGYLLTGGWPGADARAKECAQAALKTLPKPGPDLLVEHEIDFPLGTEAADGTPQRMTGFIDLVIPRDLKAGTLKIWDHKSTKDMKWAKTEAELRNNVQANVYAWWGYRLPHFEWFPVPAAEVWRPVWEEGVESVEFAHHYVKAEGPRGASVTSTPMPFEKVAGVWVSVQEDVRAMTELADCGPSDPLDVPGNPDSCEAFGGCHFGCGRRGIGYCKDVIGSDNLLRKVRSEQEKKEMATKGESIRERLAARKAAQTGGSAPAPAEEPKEEPKVEEKAESKPAPVKAEGVIAPDAPPREQSEEETKAAEPTPKARKRTAQKAAAQTVGEAAKAAEPSEQVAPAIAAEEKKAEDVKEKLAACSPSAPPTAVAPAGLKVLFVDSLPVDAAAFRAAFGADPTPVEKWLDPIKRAVAQEYGEPEYSLIEFGKGKGALAAAINAYLDDMPKIGYVSSFSRSADLVVDAAMSNGWVVIKATRG